MTRDYHHREYQCAVHQWRHGWTNQYIRTLMLHITSDQRSHDERREAMMVFTAI